MITAYFDGACKPNTNGIATFGWTIHQPGFQIAYGYGEAARGPDATNNVAEYTGLIRLLEATRDLKLRQVTIYSDSQLVVSQVSGHWRGKTVHLMPLLQRARELIEARGHRLEWVPRKDNEMADELSRKAYNISVSAVGSTEPWQKRYVLNLNKKWFTKENNNDNQNFRSW